MTEVRYQDWEVWEKARGGCEATLGFLSEAEAIAFAQKRANLTGRRCEVATSIAIAWDGAVQDRDVAPGNPSPIIVEPQPKIKWDLYWSPEGRKIATVVARDAFMAIRKTPVPYSRCKGEVYAQPSTDE